MKYGPIQKKGYDSISRHNIVILSQMRWETHLILLNLFRSSMCNKYTWTSPKSKTTVKQLYLHTEKSLDLPTETVAQVMKKAAKNLN